MSSKYVRETPVLNSRKWKHFHRYFGKVEGRILDVGSSHGNFGQHGRRQVVGVDRDLEALYILTKRNQVGVGCDFSWSFPFQPCSFEAVNCDSVVEHVLEPTKLLLEIKRILKPGGFVVIITPDLSRVKLGFWGDYTHRNPFLKTSLRQLLLDTGFDILSMSHQSYHYLRFIDSWRPFSLRRRILGSIEDAISSVVSTNLLAVARRPSGLGV